MEHQNNCQHQQNHKKHDKSTRLSHYHQTLHHALEEDIASVATLMKMSTQSMASQNTPILTASSPVPAHKRPKSPRCLAMKIGSSYDSSRPAPRSPSVRSSYSAQNSYSDPFIITSRSGNVGSFSENPPRSPKITTTYTNDSCDDASSTPSYYQTPTSSSRSPKGISSQGNSMDSPSSATFLSGPATASPRRSPNSPRKFVFEAISPVVDPFYKKFEYYEPISPVDECTSKTYSGNCNDYFGTPPQGSASAQIFESRIQNSRNILCTSPLDRNFCLHDYNRDSNEMKPLEWEMSQIDEHCLNRDKYYVKRDSCVTDSTQVSLDSNDTTNSTMATATTSFSFSEPSKTDKISVKSISDETSPSEQRESCKHRRHAINITSNPCYQVLHSSHSTLDRTYSDSITSLRHRKSTSDLTNDSEGGPSKQKTLEGCNSTSYKPRRRGSSKGGLAYLASRRSSRESMKSNTSIFSNDDIGPLTFQASKRGQQRRTSNFLELPVPDHIRPRVCSLPDRPYNPRASDDLYRLRHFSISKGNVVNCGDSIISRRSRSNTSINSTNSRASERSPFEGSCCGGAYANVDSVPTSPDESDNIEPPPRYRIVMLGDSGVGKTALVNQFMTSEYMHTYDASLVVDDEFGEKTVSVLLDNEESELVFIDHPSVEMSVENSLSTYEPHGCVVVFSVVEKSSFRVAEEIIKYLWQENYIKDKAVILVGNKADLARARMIASQEGKALAAAHDAKFIETSSGIQHNVDELLVGILKQMRLKETREKKATSSKLKNSRTHISLHLAKEILQKICLSDISKSKSCENLHVL
ncbi:uncharacterized protein LOC129245894 isoform X1 [Anastrepha obliqua]|uniref:uncharacterized protein LOC129245894 isoform X1 n=1 Tax=Anastrepha obliqua TaxID=95512 RepID=UPI002409062E|nr:uncharacterized protein LOC129245894 isoform X1 [Anastrepha obliqua]